MIVSLEQPCRYSDLYSKVNLTYYMPFIKESSQVLDLNQIIIKKGTNNLDNLILSSKTAVIESIQLIGSDNSYIQSMTIGASSISLVIVNSGDDEIVDISVIGRSIEYVQATVTETDNNIMAIIGDVKWEIGNEYIQTKENAQTYIEKVINLVNDLAGYINIVSRGDPYIQLVNTIRINSVVDSISNLDIIPLRNNYTFSNGVSCQTYGIKKSIRSIL